MYIPKCNWWINKGNINLAVIKKNWQAFTMCLDVFILWWTVKPRFQHPLDHWKSKRIPEKHLLLLYCLCNASDCVDYNQLENSEIGKPDHLTSLLRNLHAGQEVTELELDMEQQTGSKLGKEYIKSVYRHPTYLTYMQGTSCKMPGWMKHKLESRLPGEISTTWDM